MGRYWRTVLSVVAGSLLLVSAAAGDEQQVDKLRERADAAMREVQQLHEQGKHDEAQRLEQKVAELREQAERIAREGDRQPGPREAIVNRLRELSERWIDAMASDQRDAAERIQKEIHDIARDTGARLQEIMKPQLEMLERKVAELREQGQPDQAERLAGQLREMMEAHRRAAAEPQRERAQAAERAARERAESARENRERQRAEGKPGPGPDQRADMERRVQHLRVAAENLNAIGMQDLAERLHREAEEIQQALQNQNPPPRGEDLHRGAMEAMQQEFRKLHERLDEMNRRLDELSEMIRRAR